MTAGKTLLGRHVGLATRERVYETADGIEVESSENYDVMRRRVFFDDVVLVTYHRPIGALFVTINSLFTLFMVFLAVVMAAAIRTKDIWPVIVVWLVLGTPSFIAVLLRLLLRVEVINVYGRRSKATLRYSWRKQHARDVYGRLCARVRQAQRVSAPPAPERESPEPPLPPAPPLP